jgi:hypothetical protein
MLATGIMRILAKNTSRHICCLGMVAPIRLKQQGPTDSYSASMDKELPEYHNVFV